MIPRVELTFAVPVPVVLLLCAAAAAVALLFYRYTVPRVTPGRRTLLTILRAAVLVLLLAALCEPLLRLTFTSSHPPVLAVLLDDSRSMRIADRTGDRAAELRAAAASPALSELSRIGQLQYYTFGTRLRPSPSPDRDTLVLDEEATDIAGALQALAREKERTPFSAALLITDGSYTLGASPLHAAAEPGVPLFTVGIGDSSEQKDLLVTRVLANEVVYAGEQAPVDVTVKSAGFGGERVEVRLSEGGRTVDRKMITLEPGTREYAVGLAYTPAEAGSRTLTVHVSPLPGELTTANNQRTFHARVMRSKLRITVLAAAPGPDLVIVRQTLAEEKNFAVRSLALRREGGFYDGPLRAADLDSADCLVLIGLPTADTPEELLGQLSRALVDQRRPLLYIAGPSVAYDRLRQIGPAVPFTVEQPSPTEQYVYLSPSPQERANPLLTLQAEDGMALWSRLPPILRTMTTFKARPGAQVLGTCKVQTVVLPDPLLLARSVERHKSIALTGYGIWRWRLMAQGDPSTAGLLSSFLSVAVRWLTTPDANRPVRVAPTQEFFPQGQRVEFTGQVYDEASRPLDDSRLRVLARTEGRTFETELRPVGQGRYEGALEGLERGEYTFRAVAERDGKVLGEDTGRFSVGGLDVEFQETRMNVQLLRQLAARTGGAFFLPDQMQALARTLAAHPAFAAHTVVRTVDVELWTWRYLLAAIILLLALEWFLRKRSGML